MHRVLILRMHKHLQAIANAQTVAQENCKCTDSVYCKCTTTCDFNQMHKHLPIANAQSPYIANAQQPARQPANAQQPYPYIANTQSPYIANSQTPFTYQAQGRTPVARWDGVLSQQ